MPFTMIVTEGGRAALINAANTGTLPVTITQAGVSETAHVPAESDVALPGEIKRIATVAGEVVADDTIHVSILDDSADVYSPLSVALYLADGTLFAIGGGGAEVIYNKAAASMAAIAFDVVLADIAAASIAFGETNFTNPPATTEIQGVVELATVAEAQAGIDALRALTPAAAKAAVLGWLLTLDGAGSLLDADLLDGQQGAWYAPLNSPTLTGAPTAPTPGQFATNQNLATAEFVQRALGNIRAVSTISSSRAIAADEVGVLFEVPVAGITVTLPSAAGANGRVVMIYNNSPGDIAIAAGNLNSAYGTGVGAITLPAQATGTFVADGTSWNAIAGSAASGAPPKPRSAAGIGQWQAVPLGANLMYLPAGGTWAYWASNNGYGYCGIGAGTSVIFSGALNNAFGFCWRIA